MIVSLQNFAPFCLQKDIPLWLVYGNQPLLKDGLLAELRWASGSITMTTESMFFSQVEEVFQPTLFSQPCRKIMMVHEVTEKKILSYEKVLSYLSPQDRIILCAPHCRSGSPFLREVQKKENWGVVKAYEASFDQSMAILKRCLAQAGVSLPDNKCRAVAQYTQEGSWVQACQTLALYFGSGQDKVLSDDILHGLFPEAPPYGDLSVLPFLGKKAMGALHTFEQSDDKIKILRGWQRLVTQCWKLKVWRQESTESLETLAQRLFPPIFFKMMPFIIENFDHWSLGYLAQLMTKLHRLESEMKKNPAFVHNSLTLAQILLDQDKI